MFGQTFTPDLPNQMYAELVQTRTQERLPRRVARDRKTARVAAQRLDTGTTRHRPSHSTLASAA